MLKIKLCLITAAIAGAAFFATAGSKSICEGQPQYYKSGSSYFPAGEYGVDFVCLAGAGNCTYYLSNPFNPNSWAPCRTGVLTWLYKDKKK